MLTDDEFSLFRNFIYEESGIYLKETRKDFLENRLVKRMSATGINSPYWYYRHVTQQKATELLCLLDLLTVNETSFFRNKPQMDLFKSILLSELIKKKESAGDRRLRIWSAGCSTGEEPYTAAMIVLDSVPFIEKWDIKVYASDLSLTALASAAKGEYVIEKVNATVDDSYINKYFEKSRGERPFAPASDQNGCCYKIKDAVKKFVVFDFHNMKNDNGLRNLDVIFCRNVMIYFDMDEQKRLINKFYQGLNNGGYLLVGHAESLQGMNTGFQFMHSCGATAYKKE
ncbi:MAG: protein-glutamate O-methyltransferase CheR [Nitrospirae bacterium]|nr:protein-glutamate O-methyltransferase CheR [Nitrospirota bacterium]